MRGDERSHERFVLGTRFKLARLGARRGAKLALDKNCIPLLMNRSRYRGGKAASRSDAIAALRYLGLEIIRSPWFRPSPDAFAPQVVGLFRLRGSSDIHESVDGHSMKFERMLKSAL